MSTQRRGRVEGASSEPGAVPHRPDRGRAGARPAYDFAAIEERWRTRWEASGIYRPDLRTARRPFYNLMMFPYPSAEGLHVGNMYSYVGSDVQGRWRAMQGCDVFEPIGFDAFGIHSENFAIKRGVHPRPLTTANVARFRQQLKRIGNRFDWSHELQTTDASYYRWTQWVFVQLAKAGLAERKRGTVNWCPKDKTVLADEQVIAGRCERCGSVVTRRELEQWYFTITRYADRLLANLDVLDWPERVKASQRHWIGRTEGLEFAFALDGTGGVAVGVYTTRPDTIYGATFVAMAPGHPLVERVTAPEHRDAVSACRRAARAPRVPPGTTADRPVTGAFTGSHAIHPLTGERLPIWVADYVLSEHGTGAIMGVPAHDARDAAFAAAMGLPARVVVRPGTGSAPAGEPYTEPGVVVESGEFSGLASAEAAQRIVERFERLGMGSRAVRYHLRDWLISRQRYWGPPIPIVHCPGHGAVPVPEEQLPVTLPPLEEYHPAGTGSSPLASVPEFVHTACPICGGPARRETDVSDNFLDSAWYFLRYPSSDDDAQPWDPDLTRRWLPVDMYIGGAEHSVLHLLYARFITMALHDLGHLDFEEPFPRFRANGMITANGAKISKSRPETYIAPDRYLDRYGADAFRTTLLFAGPYEAGGDFSDRGMGGVVRFLNRVWQFVSDRAAGATSAQPAGSAGRAMHATIQQVTGDLEALKYNTAIAALMKYLSTLESAPVVSRDEMRAFLLLLAPFAPFLTGELWERLGERGDIHAQRWPRADAEALRDETVALVVQVNGRVRDRITVEAALDQQALERIVLTSESVRSHIAGRSIRRVVHVPGRLVNLVIDRMPPGTC